MKPRAGLLLLWLMSVACALISLAWMLVAALAGSERALTIALGYDRVGNAVAGGSDGEYISSRCWRFRAEQPYRALRAAIDAAFALMGKLEHCRVSWLGEIEDARRKLQDEALRAASSA